MTKRERVERQIRGDEVDHIPLVGGWMLGVRNMAEIGGISVEEYMADPYQGVVKANLALGSDAIVPPIVPNALDQIRAGSLEEANFADVQPEALKERADAIPESEVDILAGLDLEAFETKFRTSYEELIAKSGGLVIIPTCWDAVANFSQYFKYGYEAFLLAVALYPEAVEKIWWHSGIEARAKNAVRVKLLKALDLPPMLFTGCDICDNSGPMCSPEFLHRSYWAHVKYSLEPLVDAGIRLIHHCDGNVMPLIDDMLQSGFSGFQGFQYECTVDPYALAATRSLKGERPLFMAGLSVTRTLPFGSEDDVRQEVDYCLDYTDGGKGLFLFTSNVSGVEVPPANHQAAYQYAGSKDLTTWVPAEERPMEWPWQRRDRGSRPSI